VRGTLHFPSKSGVVGLLAAALGLPRGSNLGELAALRMAVRIDQQGELLMDYHTVSGASHATGDPAGQRLPTAAAGRLKVKDSTKVTRRYYLSDAVFVAAFSGDAAVLGRAGAALLRPRYPLALGRRSCPPSRPVDLGLLPDATDVEAALEATEWQAAAFLKNRHQSSGAGSLQLRTVVEDPAGTETLNDQPAAISPPFKPRYLDRTVRYGTIAIASVTPTPAAPHDPFDIFD
jgi:CRISPR system Cascade subunit CasD